MKKVLIAAITLAMAGAASAAIPQLNYECPGQIQMHSDEGGPVYINGKEAKLKKYSEEFYEAKGAGVTLSISNTGASTMSPTPARKARVPASQAPLRPCCSHCLSPCPQGQPRRESLPASGLRQDQGGPEQVAGDRCDGLRGRGGRDHQGAGCRCPWSCLSDKKGMFRARPIPAIDLTTRVNVP